MSTSKRRVSEPVQVYLDAVERQRLERLAEQLGATKSDVLRRGLQVLERQASDPDPHPARQTTRAAALAFVAHVGRPPNVLLYSTPELEAQAVTDWLERYDDQNFSFTDAVSFAGMAERGITDALTLDGHFAAAGFRVVP